MEEPSPILQRFVQKLHNAIKQYGGTDRLFFEDTVMSFYDKNPEMLDEEYVDWNCGNIVHGLICYIMAPHQFWLPALSKCQQREAIHVIFQLITRFNMDADCLPRELFNVLSLHRDADRFSDKETRDLLQHVLVHQTALVI